MSPLKAVKSGYGELSSVEEKEILLVVGIKKVPKKKKKVSVYDDSEAIG